MKESNNKKLLSVLLNVLPAFFYSSSLKLRSNAVDFFCVFFFLGASPLLLLSMLLLAFRFEPSDDGPFSNSDSVPVDDLGADCCFFLRAWTLASASARRVFSKFFLLAVDVIDLLDFVEDEEVVVVVVVVVVVDDDLDLDPLGFRNIIFPLASTGSWSSSLSSLSSSVPVMSVALCSRAFASRFSISFSDRPIRVSFEE
jgi:hypothetical protein